MTRKDYQLIASVISETVNATWENDKNALIWLTETLAEKLAEELANIMKRDNANFKRDLFLEACGIDENS